MIKEMPRIPRDEYPLRWKRVEEVLLREKLDMLLVYADDRHTYGAAYARYYADVPVCFEPVLLMFVPGEAPKLLVGPETDGYAREVGTIGDICVLKEFAAENEDYPFTKITPLSEVVKGKTIRRLGLGGLSLMGAQVYRAILAAFPQACTVEMDAILEPMRGIKSPAELQVIRYA